MPVKKNPSKKPSYIRKEIRLLPQQLKILSKAAKHHHLPLSRFIPRSALAYCQEVFITPDKAQIQQVVLSCREVSNALYQLAEQQEAFTDQHLRDSTDMVAVLESALLHILHHPPRLSEIIQQALESKNPQLRHWLIEKIQALTAKKSR